MAFLLVSLLAIVLWSLRPGEGLDLENQRDDDQDEQP